MKPLKFKKHLATNALHLQFFSEVISLLMKFGVDVLKVLLPFEVFQACVAKEDLCYKIIRKSNISEMKEESDKNRDMVILGIKDALRSLLRHFEANVREAAKRLKILLDAYDQPHPLIKLPYDAETAAINNLLQELDGKYLSDVEITGITAWVEELRKRNNDFDALVKAYNEQQSQKPLYRAKDVRRETDQAYDNLITVIEGNSIDGEEALYEPFITELNTLVKHYNDLIAQHLGRVRAEKERKKEATETEETEETEEEANN